MQSDPAIAAKRTTVALLSLLLAGCPAQRGGGSGGPTSMPGGVYRTTAGGTAVGGEKGTTGGGGGKGLNDLTVAGLITLGVSYGSTVVGGQIAQEALFTEFDRMIGAEGAIDRLWFPVIGAWSALIYNEDTVRPNCESAAMGGCELTTLGSALILAGATAQTIGLYLTVQGLLKGSKGPSGGKPSGVVIAPHGNSHSAGLAVGGSF